MSEAIACNTPVAGKASACTCDIPHERYVLYNIKTHGSEVHNQETNNRTAQKNTHSHYSESFMCWDSFAIFVQIAELLS